MHTHNRSRATFLLLTLVGLAIQSVLARAGDEPGLPEGVTLVRQLRYREGPGNSWTLDVAMPKDTAGKPRPAIVFIHGGGWIEGDKSSFSTVERRNPASIIDYARLGFVALTINYRLAGEAPFPAALHDCKCAVRWLRAHAGEYHVDVDHIGAWGNSAGGHLALLLAMVDKEAGFEGDGPWQEFSSRVQSAVSDSGPIDLVYQHEQGALRTVVEKFMGGPPEGARLADYKKASPSNQIRRDTPPLLLLYGVSDNQVPVETADRFVTALGAAGLKDVSYHRLAGVDHCPHSLVRVRWLQPVVNEFFQRTLAGEAAR